MYLWLIEDGDIHFNNFITDFVPELAAAAESPGGLHLLWKDITVGELASHLAGISRDYSTPSETLLILPQNQLSQLDLPRPAHNISCGLGESSSPCDRKYFYKGFLQRRPVYRSSTTPIYSNSAFRVLGLENITGVSFERMFESHLVKRLNLHGTGLEMPKNDTLAVIPLSTDASWWNHDLGENAPAGGIYSTPSDLSTIGRSILKSSILSPSLTRRWMTPRTHTSSLVQSVGAPWEIDRIQNLPGQTIDLYTKNGGVGLYAAVLMLSPDLDFGISIMAGGASADGIVAGLAEVVTQNFIPALRTAGQEEAHHNIAGTYSNPSVSASIKITSKANKTGLVVSDWMYNGTAVSAIYNAATGASDLNTPALDIAFYPTDIASDFENGTRIVYYRAVFQRQGPDSSPETAPGSLDLPCGSWALAGSLYYGNVALDDVAFTLNREGRAISFEPRFLGVSLKRD